MNGTYLETNNVHVCEQLMQSLLCVGEMCFLTISMFTLIMFDDKLN